VVDGVVDVVEVVDCVVDGVVEVVAVVDAVVVAGVVAAAIAEPPSAIAPMAARNIAVRLALLNMTVLS
jgi:hypothetical protein